MHVEWWRPQMEIFSALLDLCAGNSPVTGEFPSQRPVPRSFDVFFDLRLNKRLSKQSWGWWFETSSRSLWRHCHVMGHALGTALWLPVRMTSQYGNLYLSCFYVNLDKLLNKQSSVGALRHHDSHATSPDALGHHETQCWLQGSFYIF